MESADVSARSKKTPHISDTHESRLDVERLGVFVERLSNCDHDERRRTIKSLSAPHLAFSLTSSKSAENAQPGMSPRPDSSTRGPTPLRKATSKIGANGRVPLAVEIERHSSGLHRQTSLGAVTETAAGYRETIHPAIRATTSRSIPL
jgi:hypothetical protein